MRMPSARTEGRCSRTTVQMLKTSVRRPTVEAARRWPCSKSTPPTMAGNTCPNESGQSGTARPDPVLVTRPPRNKSAYVAPAVRTAKRCRAMEAERGIGSVRCGHLAVESACLRQVVFLDQRRRILVRTAVDGGKRAREVAVRRRRRRLPLERVGMPGIPFGATPGDQAPEEVDHDDQLRGAETQCADRDDHVDVLHRLQELVLHRVVDAAHVSAGAD